MRRKYNYNISVRSALNWNHSGNHCCSNRTFFYSWFFYLRRYVFKIYWWCLMHSEMCVKKKKGYLALTLWSLLQTSNIKTFLRYYCTTVERSVFIIFYNTNNFVLFSQDLNYPYCSFYVGNTFYSAINVFPRRNSFLTVD